MRTSLKRRLAALALLALPLGGCASTFDKTPSSALDYEDTTPSKSLTAVPPKALVKARWALPASSPWARYEKLDVLAGLQDGVVRSSLPDVFRNETVNSALGAAERLVSRGVPAKTLWIVDMRGAASVAFGATLNRRLPGEVAVIPVFKNQPSSFEVVPARETLAAMTQLSPHEQGGPDAAVPVILLDAWRRAQPALEGEGVVENRYSLSPADLPSAATLKEMGIQRVIYVVEDALTATETEQDVSATLDEYTRVGIGAYKTDLDELNGVQRVVDKYIANRVSGYSIYGYDQYGRGVFFRNGYGYGGGYAGHGPWSTNSSLYGTQLRYDRSFGGSAGSGGGHLHIPGGSSDGGGRAYRGASPSLK